MKDFKIIKSDIDKGYEFVIETIDKDDYRKAIVGFSLNIQKYYIHFNGKLIAASKTFKRIISRLNELDNKFPLEDDSNYN